MVEESILQYLEIIEDLPPASNSHNRRGKYLCYCGNYFITKQSAVNTGRTRSCGCYRSKYIAELKTTHGNAARKYMSKEYACWRAIKARCLNANTKIYKYYGGRGITICDEWKDSFSNFLMDIGPKPSNYHTIDRVDNNGNYCPENCRWATKKEQARNKRNNKILVYNGISKCLPDWAEEFNITTGALAGRLSRGWTVERALTTIF